LRAGAVGACDSAATLDSPVNHPPEPTFRE
jgi:hypothetical protein